MTPPWVVPPGFYYHYKRSENADIDVGAYEVLGVNVDESTEDLLVEYRPIYSEGAKYLRERGAKAFSRPIKSFVEMVRVGDTRIARFIKITDENTVSRLEYFRDQYYHRATR